MNFASILIVLLSVLVVVPASANVVNEAVASDARINAQREEQFLRQSKKQETLLTQSRLRLQQAEQRRELLKSQFGENEQTLMNLERQLKAQSGQLGEVFGVVKQVGTELQPLLQDTLTAAEYPHRQQALAFAKSREIPKLVDLKSLWQTLQQELDVSGQLSKFEAAVVDTNGNESVQTVMRVGTFAAFTSSGQYLDWNGQVGKLSIFPVQPAMSVQYQAGAVYRGEGDSVTVDPSRGELIEMLGRMPSLQERVLQGGYVGAVIIGLGFFGLLFAVYRIVYLLALGGKVKRQLQSLESPSTNNPLGRLLLALDLDEWAPEHVEAKVDEHIVKELPKIESGQSLLKLLSAVAPLLGLLGTVVGMIATFQSITLYGTSDPQLMAGGISQALVTTVLGLVVAIPLLFSHGLVVGQGRRLTRVLQEKSLAALADSYQQQNVGVARVA